MAFAMVMAVMAAAATGAHDPRFGPVVTAAPAGVSVAIGGGHRKVGRATPGGVIEKGDRRGARQHRGKARAGEGQSRDNGHAHLNSPYPNGRLRASPDGTVPSAPGANGTTNLAGSAHPGTTGWQHRQCPRVRAVAQEPHAFKAGEPRSGRPMRAAAGPQLVNRLAGRKQG